MKPINVRSDTQTLPTEEMLEAMRHAPLGDDVYKEDPTVNRLEAAAAEITGKEAALFVASGTMGNLIALMVHGKPGDEVILDPESHIFYYEAGSLAGVAGLMPFPVVCPGGIPSPEDLRRAIRPANVHHPVPRLFCLENTHNRSGGRVISPALHRELCDVAHEHGLAVHLDGARIFNAATAAGVPVTEYTKSVDSVMFCLSKGLSCPVGSMIAGSRDFIDKANWARKRIGGGMRQAGVIAAAGIVALESMIGRLAEDHSNARALAEGINGTRGFEVDMSTVQSNMVVAHHGSSGLGTDQMLALLEKYGVLASGRPPESIRLVTNRHHDSDTIDEVVNRIRAAMGSFSA